MKLYHGSNTTIEKIDLTKSKPFKDFGRGFYLSPNRQQAERMAQQKVSQLLCGEAVVSVFYFDEKNLSDNSLSVKIFDGYSVDWVKFILKNRNMNNPHPVHHHDIVFGPIADDGVTFQLRRHESGSISIEELVEKLKFSQGVTYQYYFGTDLAISKLQKI